MNLDSFIGDCYELMHDLVEHHGKEVMMVLVNKKEQEESLAYAYGKQEDALIEIRPHTKDNEALWSIPEWDFNLDNYFFELIENDFDIGMITPEMHGIIRDTLKDLYTTELINSDGVRKYLQYCKDNEIEISTELDCVEFHVNGVQEELDM